ncbi:hypothetical protein BCR32DRAFT_270572, partial [Anaeromyces robustus]
MNLFIFLLLVFQLLLNVYASKSLDVYNEKDFNKALSEKDEELLINVKTPINISKTYNITYPYKKLTINGDSIGSLIYLDLYHQIIFSDTIEDVEVRNISITGNLFFNNNKKIKIQFVEYIGTIDSYLNNNNEFKFTESMYLPPHVPFPYCLNLGGNLELAYLEVYGNSNCEKRLLNYNGYNKHTVSISNTFFNGDDACALFSFVDSIYIDINQSTIVRSFVKDKNDGGGIKIINSKFIIRYSSLYDSVSVGPGGLFYINDPIYFLADHIDIHNITSYDLGSLAYITVSDNSMEKKIRFQYITQDGCGNLEGMNKGGLIFAIEKYASVELDNYLGQNLINNKGSGSAFYLSDYSSLNINEFKINNVIGSDSDGLFLYTINSRNVQFTATNIELSNFKQNNIKPTSIFWVDEHVKVVIQNMKIINSMGYHHHLIYQNERSNVDIKDFEVHNFYSDSEAELISVNTAVNSNVEITAILSFERLILDNIQSPGVLIKGKYGSVTITDSHIYNISDPDYITEDESHLRGSTSISNPKIADISNFFILIIRDALLENMIGDSGFSSSEDSLINIYDSNFFNSYFKDGIIEIDHRNEKYGSYSIQNSKFENITSEYGAIINIKTTNFGGIVYSISPYTSYHLLFNNCTFTNVTASKGSIAFSYNINSEPRFSNIDELKKINGSFATNPTKLKFFDDKIHEYSIISSEKIPEEISLITLNTDISSTKFDDFVFLNLYVNDTYNAELLGQSNSYCWDDSCVFPPVKVIGNPGTYKIRLMINSFGHFARFDNNYIDIQVEIKECYDNDTYKYQNIESNNGLKSCYKPKCEPACKAGKCVANNVCDCSNSFFVGSRCDQYDKMKRVKLIDESLRKIIMALSCLVVVTIVLTIIYRNAPIIKGGSVDFLILILFGILIYYGYVLLLTFERNKMRCYWIYLFNNIGFSLVFGSIFVKTYRIYKIFFETTKANLGIK